MGRRQMEFYLLSTWFLSSQCYGNSGGLGGVVVVAGCALVAGDFSRRVVVALYAKKSISVTWKQLSRSCTAGLGALSLANRWRWDSIAQHTTTVKKQLEVRPSRNANNGALVWRIENDTTTNGIGVTVVWRTHKHPSTGT
jgi:hypothetical protein